MDEELKPQEQAPPPVAEGVEAEVAARAQVHAGNRMPTLYLGHGAPPLLEDDLWVRQLATWTAGLPKPSAILIVSAHWQTAPMAPIPACRFSRSQPEADSGRG